MNGARRPEQLAARRRARACACRRPPGRRRGRRAPGPRRAPPRAGASPRRCSLEAASNRAHAPAPRSRRPARSASEQRDPRPGTRRGELAIAVRDHAAEVLVLALDPVEVLALRGRARRRSASSASTKVRRRQQAAGDASVQREHLVDAEPARDPLVDERRVDVAVADDPGAARRAPGRITRATCSARAEANSVASAQARHLERRGARASRIASPSGVPPGSRVATTSWPCSRSQAASSPPASSCRSRRLLRS